MSKKLAVQLPLAPLPDLLAWWRAERVRGMVIGGLAASLLGEARSTVDVDAVVLLDDDRWQAFYDTGPQFGFAPRLEDALAFARQSRVLLMQHRQSGINIDISFGGLPFEKEAVEQAIALDVGGVMVPVATPEDLIIMKAVAHRAQDLLDIQQLLEVHPKLDVKRVRRWVRDFAEVLEMPEILADLERLLSGRPKPKKRRGKS